MCINNDLFTNTTNSSIVNTQGIVLTIEENIQYSDILDLFCKCMKKEITSTEFIQTMDTFPQIIINYFTQNPIPIEFLNKYNI